MFYVTEKYYVILTLTDDYIFICHFAATLRSCQIVLPLSLPPLKAVYKEEFPV